MVNYLRKFVPKLAEKTQALRVLLQQNMEWVWGVEQREAAKQLQNEIAARPTLAFYSRTAPTWIAADASSYGLGSVLELCQKGVWKPVAYRP
ncbi:hypothetical protein PR048_000714 [Dryococelus australis]|uniref:Reverse transcriptase/retrotransposon-derived protein RNase H-like domain-containing protein n=1 Tax=Dryococelus australis TaxID=614101 RepID=A0ABQ9IFE0_9NEOP|nr:hypothetical protein PR048_000714 [Dryococelus australis]